MVATRLLHSLIEPGAAFAKVGKARSASIRAGPRITMAGERMFAKTTGTQASVCVAGHFDGVAASTWCSGLPPGFYGDCGKRREVVFPCSRPNPYRSAPRLHPLGETGNAMERGLQSASTQNLRGHAEAA
jgi:hypothetical protein